MKFTKDRAFKFKKVGIRGAVYLNREQSPEAGVALIETNTGHETEIKSTKNAWIYYVIAGKGKFVIGGEEVLCKEEELIYVPKNTRFYYQGKLKMLLITVPAWEEKYEVTLGKADPDRVKNRDGLI